MTAPSTTVRLRQPAHCAVAMQNYIDELKRRKEQEQLRRPLFEYGLFSSGKDPRGDIDAEDLKKLVRHWKLHEARGFWKTHPEKHDLARAILKYMHDMNLFQDDPEDEPKDLPKKMVWPSRPGQKQQRRSLSQGPSRVLRPYNGDLFSTGTENVEGLTLRSRFYEPEPKKPYRPPEADIVVPMGGWPRLDSMGSDVEGKVSVLSPPASVVTRQSGGLSPTRSVVRLSPTKSSVRLGGSVTRSEHTASAFDLGSMGADGMRETDEEAGKSMAIQMELLEANREASDIIIKVLKQLYAFSCSSGREMELVSEGALDVLLHVDTVVTNGVAEALSAACLANLTTSKEARLYMLANGSIRRLLVPLSESIWSTPEIKLRCAQAMFNLTLERGSEQVGVAEAALALGTMCPNAEGFDIVRRTCCAALINLATDNDFVYSQKLRITEYLMPILSTLPPSKSNSIVVIETVLRLSRLEGVRKEVVDTGLVGIVYSQLRSPDPLNAASLLLLARTVHNIGAVAVDIASQRLPGRQLADVLEHLSQCNDLEVSAVVAASICSIASSPSRLPWVESANIVQDLANLLHTLGGFPKNGHTQQQQKAHQHHQSPDTIVGAKPRASKRPSFEISATSHIVLALAHIAASGSADMLSSVTASSIHAILLTQASSRELKVAVASVGALCNLVSQADSCEVLFKDGILSAIITSIAFWSADARGTDVLRAAAGVLSNLALCAAPSLAAALGEGSGPTQSLAAALALLCGVADHPTRLTAMGACGAVSSYAAARKRLLDCGIIQVVARVGLTVTVAPEKPLFRDRTTSSIDGCERTRSSSTFAEPTLLISQDKHLAGSCAAIICEFARDTSLHEGMLQQGALALLLALCSYRGSSLSTIKDGENDPADADTAAIHTWIACSLSNLAAGPVDATSARDILCATLALVTGKGCTNPRVCFHGCRTMLYLSAQPSLRKWVGQQAQALRFLIDSMRSSMSDTEILVADTFKYLSTEPTCATVMIEGGLIKDFIVVALLRSKVTVVREVCSQVFANLFSHEESRPALVKQGMLWAIVKAAKDGTIVSRAVGVKCLAGLAADGRFHSEILELGPHTMLLALAKQGDAEIKYNCARVLACLCVGGSGKQALLHPKPGLVECLRVCLGGMGSDSVFGQRGMSNASYSAEDDFEFEEDTLRCCIHTCYRLAVSAISTTQQRKSNDGALILVREGTIDLLFDMIDPVDVAAPTLLDAVLCAAHLLAISACRALLSSRGSITTWLVKACQRGSSTPACSEVLVPSLRILSLLSQGQGCINEMVQSGVIEGGCGLVKTLVVDCPSNTVQSQALALITQVMLSASYEEPHHERMMKAGALSLLCGPLLTLAQDSPQRLRVLSILRNITIHSPASIILCENPESVAALAVLTTSTGDALRELSGASTLMLASVYVNLSCVECNRVVLAENEMTMAALVRIGTTRLQDKAMEAECKHCVVLCLYNLMSYPASEKFASQHGAPSTLAELASGSTQENTRLYCSMAISFRSSCEEGATFSEGSVRALASLVSSTPTDMQSRRVTIKPLPVLIAPSVVTCDECELPDSEMLELNSAWCMYTKESEQLATASTTQLGASSGNVKNTHSGAVGFLVDLVRVAPPVAQLFQPPPITKMSNESLDNVLHPFSKVKM